MISSTPSITMHSNDNILTPCAAVNDTLNGMIPPESPKVYTFKQTNKWTTTSYSGDGCCLGLLGCACLSGAACCLLCAKAAVD